MARTDDKLNVLILAAGLGTRLRPLTSEIPKPLVRVYDKSILEIQMERAKSLGDVRLHANAHYLAEQIVREGERLGFEKVWVELSIIQKNHFDSARQMIETMKEEVEKHRNGATPNDDLTMLCMKIS